METRRKREGGIVLTEDIFWSQNDGDGAKAEPVRKEARTGAWKVGDGAARVVVIIVNFRSEADEVEVAVDLVLGRSNNKKLKEDKVIESIAAKDEGTFSEAEEGD